MRSQILSAVEFLDSEDECFIGASLAVSLMKLFDDLAVQDLVCCKGIAMGY